MSPEDHSVLSPPVIPRKEKYRFPQSLVVHRELTNLAFQLLYLYVPRMMDVMMCHLDLRCLGGEPSWERGRIISVRMQWVKKHVPSCNREQRDSWRLFQLCFAFILFSTAATSVPPPNLYACQEQEIQQQLVTESSSLFPTHPKEPNHQFTNLAKKLRD